ncbi:LRR receptor-like serine/threonine-protein kinase FLS2 [Heracleum sosnowskyi]|uniref:LRR receptor-like serine/threonine-protein kinase FLS2 n=1 Tax=Heracleum sosnowskyi TaxID=360622 RepID=A0AAD8J804_9APIA|nr:LRR receptor-like serine/threonine-protein kinase FLS2 [Heracleum sosnowskyi]
MKNVIHYYHHLIVFGLLFSFMLCMQTIVLSCKETEKIALLDIQRGGFSSSRGWGEQEENCCKWRGVECDHHTGHVTYLDLSLMEGSYLSTGSRYSRKHTISSSLLHLKNLKYLDLRFNSFAAPIPSFICSLTNLVYLDLSNCDFQGVIPDELRNLTKLNHLDLSHNDFYTSPFPKYIASFTNLNYLGLSTNQLSGEIPYQLGSLMKVDLSNNLLQGQIPNSFGVMSGITYLNLSKNQLEGVIPDSFHNLSSLQTVDFGNNKFIGNLQDLLNLLPKATYLNLSTNQLDGILPNSFHNQSSLQTVDFSQNSLTGNLQDLFLMLPNATLQELFISQNHLTGSLPDITKFSFLKKLDVHSNLLNGLFTKIFEHKSILKFLDLSNNYLQGSLPDFTGCSSLLTLLLRGNQFTEWQTQSFGQLTNLQVLDLSMNSINSTISEHHLSKLHSLNWMDASFNSLTFNLSSEWLPPFALEKLSLASCKLGPNFPLWIRNQTGIRSLNFSNNQINTIPMWFWNISTSMKMLDLSSNTIGGILPSISFGIEELDLSSNYFEGSIPLISPECSKINLSHNKFSGKLSFIFEVPSSLIMWSFLDLSHNLFTGEVPDSWGQISLLVFLNLGNNNFSGRIPVSIGSLYTLQTLILRKNKLHGELPESLRYADLGFMDLSFNRLSGTVPAWIGQDLPKLYALILKSNKLHGSIPRDLCHLSNLRFLDLSTNRFSGHIPECFSNLTAMVTTGIGLTDHYYIPRRTYRRHTRYMNYYALMPNYFPVTYSFGDQVFAGWKGKEREYKRNFAYLKLIDLSSNEFTGEIPIGITKLLDLKGLNLSRNKFYGTVPVQIGRLLQLDVLDLSSNKFSGSQLQLFNSSSYERNPGLCGPPLTKRCPGDETKVEVEPPSNRNEVDEDEILYERWLYISAALGFSTTFSGICATLLVNKRWRNAYFLFLSNMKDKLYVFMAVRIARLKLLGRTINKRADHLHLWWR